MHEQDPHLNNPQGDPDLSPAGDNIILPFDDLNNAASSEVVNRSFIDFRNRFNELNIRANALARRQDVTPDELNELRELHQEIAHEFEDNEFITFNPDERNELRTILSSVRDKQDTVQKRIDDRERGAVFVPDIAPDMIVAAKYFEGYLTLHGHPEWRDGGWVNASARELGLAIWKEAHHIIEDSPKGTSPYIKDLHLFSHNLVAIRNPDKPSVDDLLNHFAALANLFKDNTTPIYDEQKASEIIALSVRLKIDFATLQTLTKAGYEVHSLVNGGPDLGKYLKKNAANADDLAAVFGDMGRGYEEDGASPERLAQKNVKAFNVAVAMNEPIFHEIGILSSTLPSENPNVEPVFWRGVKERNAQLTYFPEEFPNAEFNKSKIARRRLVQMLSGQDGPLPWEQPQFRTYKERLAAARNYLLWKMYGSPNVTQDQVITIMETGEMGVHYSENKAHPDSLYGRFKRALENGAKEGSTKTFDEHQPRNDRPADAWLTHEEHEAIEKGFVSELIAYNMFVWGLEQAKASGTKMVRDNTLALHYEDFPNGNSYPIIDFSSGPLGDALIDRYVNAAPYRGKSSFETGQEGSVGPKRTIDFVYSTLDPMYDSMAVIPKNRAEGFYGTTLKQRLFMSDNGDLPSNVFSDYIVIGTEDVSNWGKSAELGIELYTTLIEGLGIDWSKIVARQLGSEVTVTFDTNALKKIGDLSRKVYYILTRDFGKPMNTWNTDEEYIAYRAVEDIFYQTWDATQIPNQVQVDYGGGRTETLTVTPKMRADVEKNNLFLSPDHIRYDGRKTKDEQGNVSSTGMTRYQTTVHNAYRLPMGLPPEAELTDFEKTVCRKRKQDEGKPAPDSYLALKKLIIGTILMGDMASKSHGIN
ncbi:MAG: hypothetical protein M3Q81_03675, partial [bacterium]|nr:hypothetical protein [bacterium]